MPDLDEARQQLQMAEQAALAGDFASARELLSSALRIQEVELGPQHPELISTLSNLAVLAEKTGRSDEAESGYRRVAALASASLPPDHEMVVESRRNLEAFCREHGLEAFPASPPPAAPSGPDVSQPGTNATPIAEKARASAPAPRESSVKNAPVLANRVAPGTSRRAQQRSSSQLPWIALAALTVAAVVLVQMNRRPAAERVNAPQETVETAATELATSPPPTGETPSPAPVVPQPDERPSTEAAPPAADSTAAPGTASSVVTAQLCHTFSTSGADWRCDPAGNPAAQGSMVLYTRIKSPSDAVVMHRWYRGDVLRQSVRLTIRANASDGYRTYSRHTVDAGDWRVDVRSADGDLLHEQSFSVR